MKHFNIPASAGLIFLIFQTLFSPVANASDSSFIDIASGSDQVTITQSTRRSLKGGRHTTRVIIPEPTVNVTPVPVPATAALFGSALLGFSLIGRRKENIS